MDGDIVVDTENAKKNQFGIYQAKTRTVKLFDGNQKNEQFFHYPHITK
ncbi:MAG: hypothetical protein WCI00_04590 [bacterium]